MPFSSKLPSFKISATSSQETLQNPNISSNLKSNNEINSNKNSIVEKDGHGNQNASVRIIPVPSQEESSTPGSPMDIVIILSIAFLFILFFFLWIRAYYSELERRRLEKMRQWQVVMNQQRIQNLWSYEDEQLWKRMYPECLPLYSEHNVLMHEEIGSYPEVLHTLYTESGIQFNQVVGDEIQSSEQVSDFFGSIAQIRTPPPAYSS